jgi:hypothetical protein
MAWICLARGHCSATRRTRWWRLCRIRGDRFEPCRPQGFRRPIKPLVDELPRKLMLENLNDTRTAVIREARVSMSRGLALTGNR